MKAVAFLVAAVVILLGAKPAWSDTCRRLDSFTLRVDWYGGVFVPVRAGGRTLNMLIDTGGTTSMVTASTATALHLRTHPIRNKRIVMYGGGALHDFVRLDDMQIAGSMSSPEEFLVVPNDRLPDELSGTLAPDFLSRYDVDFDFANGRLNLLASCPAYFHTSAAVPIQLDASHHVIVPVWVDGKIVMAYLDTGASRSDLSLEAAELLFGFSSATPGLRPAQGPDTEDGIYYYPFHALKVGGAVVDLPKIALVPDRVSRRQRASPQMVLGMSVLRHYHVMIGYHEQMLYIAPVQ